MNQHNTRGMYFLLFKDAISFTAEATAAVLIGGSNKDDLQNCFAKTIALLACLRKVVLKTLFIRGHSFNLSSNHLLVLINLGT
jgi:hypothetical protein